VRFITKVEITKFRSISSVVLNDVGDFSVLAGLNNSGKSNVLRALNLFFTDHVEPGQAIDFSKDLYRKDLNSKKKKRIAIELEFSLPNVFKFRKGLEQTASLLGRDFKLRKEWRPDSDLPDYFLNGSTAQLSLDDGRKIENFLRLVSVRYIPNRVIPTELISREHSALRDVLVRRLSSFQKQSTRLFSEISKTSRDLLADLSEQMHIASPDLESVSLSTAKGLADLAFKFGYQLSEGGMLTSEHEQGSGIQSLLMFRTLSLIDQDFFKQFGWKQASLWLVEEPESSLHTAMEAQVAFFLRELSTRKDSRLQTLATTHSDLQIQYSTTPYLVSKISSLSGGVETEVKLLPHRDLLNQAAKFGISRWVDPILFHPLEPIVLVEGKFDRDFIIAANQALGIDRKYRVFTLEELQQNSSKGGIDTLIAYVKDRASAIKIRSSAAPVILLADWDAASKGASLANTFKAGDSFHFINWDTKEANPKLNSSFRGIERFMGSDLISKGSSNCNECVATKPDGTHQVAPEDFGKLKNALNKIVLSGINAQDASYAKPMLTLLNSFVL